MRLLEGYRVSVTACHITAAPLLGYIVGSVLVPCLYVHALYVL